MRRPLRAVSLLLATVLLGVLAPGCGSGGPRRPVLSGSAPAAGSAVASGLGSVRLDFDEPVRLLLDYQAQVLREGVLLPSVAFQRDDEPTSVRVRLLAPEAFSPGAYEVRVLEGLVVNGDDHYALEPQSFTFDVGGAPAWFVGSPLTGHVVAYDDATRTATSATPTPGGRAPVALVAEQQGSATRVFVQLATGAGTGRSLAHYVVGDTSMAEVLLTTSGGDLLASARGLLLEPEGAQAYAVFRDASAGCVRLARVRTSDGVETGSLLLAAPPAPDCAPTALLWRAGEPDTLLVVARSGGAGWLCTVDAAAFAELDADTAVAGTQARALGLEAGSAALGGSRLLVAPPSATTAGLESFQLDDGTLESFPVLQPGAPRGLRVTYDQALVVEGLAAGPATELLATRTLADLTVFSPVDLADDVGGVDQGATEVLALAQVPGQRRLYVLLDASCVAFVSWDGTVLVQDDLDPLQPGSQVLPLSGLAAGATCVGTREGGLP
ncbi:MAG: hypothetical protein ACKOSS_07290 [Planctomycetia bacterium]